MRGRVGVTALVVAGVLAAALAGTALAAAPEMFTEEFEIEQISDEVCGDFETRVHFIGTYAGKTFFDRNGNPTKVQLKGKDVVTVTNTENGKTVTGTDNWVETIDVNRNTLTIRGAYIRLVMPGEGALLLDVGRLQLDLESFEPTFVAGPPGAWFGGTVPTLCDALRG